MVGETILSSSFAADGKEGTSLLRATILNFIRLGIKEGSREIEREREKEH
jgi:hypothetical protein